MACFRLRCVRPFYFDARRLEIGDSFELDELSVARDLLARGLVVADAPLPINGDASLVVAVAERVN